MRRLLTFLGNKLKYFFILFLTVSLWGHDITHVDTTHTYFLGHEINSRSNTKHPFDWFLNLEGQYEYKKGINPLVLFYISTERDDDTVFNAHKVRVQSDYFFIEDHVDEEHKVRVFSTGAHYKWNVFKLGYGAFIDKDP